jgi:hypothetical protein
VCVNVYVAPDEGSHGFMAMCTSAPTCSTLHCMALWPSARFGRCRGAVYWVVGLDAPGGHSQEADLHLEADSPPEADSPQEAGLELGLQLDRLTSRGGAMPAAGGSGRSLAQPAAQLAVMTCNGSAGSSAGALRTRSLKRLLKLVRTTPTSCCRD